MKKDWLKNPDVCAKVTAAVLLVALFLGIHFFADDFFNKTFTLAISGNVNGLVEYLRSFGPWAILISFVLDVLINAGSVFPSITELRAILFSRVPPQSGQVVSVRNFATRFIPVSSFTFASAFSTV